MSWEIEPITDSDNNSLYCLVNSGDLRAFSLNNIATITFSTFEEADMLRGKLESYEPFYTLPLQSLKTLLIALAKISEERWENTVRLVLPDSNHFSAASIINFKLEWKRSGTFHADKEKCLHYSSPLRARRVSGYIGEAAAIANAFNELVTITLPAKPQRGQYYKFLQLCDNFVIKSSLNNMCWHKVCKNSFTSGLYNQTTELIYDGSNWNVNWFIGKQQYNY